MNRFFVAPDALVSDRFPVPAKIAHQVTRVLRLRDGDRIVLLAGDGFEVVCRLDAGGCAVEERRPAAGEPGHRLTVVQALLKGDGLDEVVQRGTEVGVVAFRLVVTERCIARAITPRKLERLRAIAQESAEQSERGIVPAVEAPVPFREAFAPGSVLLYERHTGARLGAVDAPSSVIIGPEGGFTPDETAAAKEAGVTLAGLGPRVLRSQTVAAAVAAVILSRTGDFA